MTPPAIPASFETKQRTSREETTSSRIIAVAIKDITAKAALLEHLELYPDLQSCKIVLIHIARPQWLVTEPHSGVGGQRMMIEHRDLLVFQSAVLEDIKHTLKAKYPLLQVEYRIKSGEPHQLLPGIVESIDADRLIVFTSNDRRIPRLGKPLGKKLSEQCSCPVDQIALKQNK